MENEPVRQMTQGHLKEFAAALIGAIPELTFDQAQAVKRGKGLLVAEVRKNIERHAGLSPKGAKLLRPCSIIRLTQVPVQYDYTWDQAIDHAATYTSPKWDIKKLGDLYVAEHTGVVLTNITLVQFEIYYGLFAEKVKSEQILASSAEWKFGRTINPRECFAIGEHFPKLNTMPGFFDPRDRMTVYSLKECTFRDERQSCYVFFYGDGRECASSPVAIQSWNRYDWFGFVSE